MSGKKNIFIISNLCIPTLQKDGITYSSDADKAAEVDTLLHDQCSLTLKNIV